MLDKNGKEIKAGDIVEIKGAYFKIDNGFYYVEQDGTNPTYASHNELTLKKISKFGKLSTAKNNLLFYPVKVFVNDYMKRALANNWNKEHCTIEVVKSVANYAVIAKFESEAKLAEDAAQWNRSRGYGDGYVNTYLQKADYFRKAVERMKIS